MNKTNLKVYIILLVIFGIMGILAFIISNSISKEKEILNSYVIIDGNRFFQYDDEKWLNVGFIDDMVMKKFRVYTNNDYIDSYHITEGSNKYYFFDDNYDSYNISSPYIAFSDDSKVSLVNYEVNEFDDDDYDNVNSYFKKINISYDGDYSIQKKYIVDLNNDNKDDNIYILSNQLYSDKVFYIIFAKVNNKYINIDKQLNTEDIINYELGWVLNIGENNLNDIILKESVYETYDYYLYRSVKKGEYTKILPE